MTSSEVKTVLGWRYDDGLIVMRNGAWDIPEAFKPVVTEVIYRYTER